MARRLSDPLSAIRRPPSPGADRGIALAVWVDIARWKWRQRHLVALPIDNELEPADVAPIDDAGAGCGFEIGMPDCILASWTGPGHRLTHLI
jgi:hypothetical protein